MSHPLNRRTFLKTTAALAGAATVTGGRPALARVGPNEKLNLAIIGVANRGAANLEGVEGENIVALCDVDARFLGKAAERFPKAKTFRDFRKMLEMGGIDAVVVSTPDHTHAPAAALALRAGKPVYCEKPLAHTVHEARVLAELANKAGVATQMGTQIHAGSNYRRAVEIVRAGTIGSVAEVHVWLGNKTWSGGARPTDTQPVPSYLDWDLWLGPSPTRPYHDGYHPFDWRRWWDFGEGTLGDMGCHYLDLPFWALDLRHPTTISAEGSPVNPETGPEHLVVRYAFPARGDRPPVALTWYDGGPRPPKLAEMGISGWESGILFVGEKGHLLVDYERRKLLPEDQFRDFIAPAQTIPDSIGHHAEWINACKTGSATTCPFDYGGALTETVLLGNVAYRTGQSLDWDAPALKARNCPEADAFLRREFRKGWTL